MYSAGLAALLNGDLDLASAPVRAQLVNGTPFDDTDATIADVANQVGPVVTVAVTGIAGPAVAIAPIEFVDLTATATALVFYALAGPLICFVDRRADTIPLTFTATDETVRFTFDPWIRL
jgi:hypothetical protein